MCVVCVCVWMLLIKGGVWGVAGAHQDEVCVKDDSYFLGMCGLHGVLIC